MLELSYPQFNFVAQKLLLLYNSNQKAFEAIQFFIWEKPNIKTIQERETILKKNISDVPVSADKPESIKSQTEFLPSPGDGKKIREHQEEGGPKDARLEQLKKELAEIIEQEERQAREIEDAFVETRKILGNNIKTTPEEIIGAGYYHKRRLELEKELELIQKSAEPKPDLVQESLVQESKEDNAINESGSLPDIKRPGKNMEKPKEETTMPSDIDKPKDSTIMPKPEGETPVVPEAGTDKEKIQRAEEILREYKFEHEDDEDIRIGKIIMILSSRNREKWLAMKDVLGKDIENNSNINIDSGEKIKELNGAVAAIISNEAQIGGDETVLKWIFRIAKLSLKKEQKETHE